MSIQVTVSEEGLTPEEHAEEVRVWTEHAQKLMDEGTQRYSMTMRRYGRLRLAFDKEVGPPPWRWPKLLFKGRLRPRFALSVGAGWRSTAYVIYIVWGRKLNEA